MCFKVEKGFLICQESISSGEQQLAGRKSMSKGKGLESSHLFRKS